MSVARRSVVSIGWNAVARIIQTAVIFLRMILLARWLPVELFGVYAGLKVILQLTISLTSFGMTGAFIHRAEETEDEGRAVAVLFTLRLLFIVAWTVIMLLLLPWLTRAGEELPFAVLVLATAVLYQARIAEAILTRRVVHRRLALVQTVSILFSSLVSVGLAWFYNSIWVLVAADLVITAVTVIGYYLWRPVWRIQFRWDKDVIRYYFDFGKRGFAAQTLYQALDRVDDLWVRLFLGDVALGFYSRAYTLATYPRQILAMPVSSVVAGTYAELKYDRLRLSQAFFRTNALLIRTSFFLGGLLALLAPELIRFALTEKWLPMLTAFRLMLIFTLLDPLKQTTASVIGFSGKPEKLAQTRAIQLVILVIGLILLAPRWDIAGVAVAVDVMLVVGIGLFLWQAREFVDFSYWALFAAPTAALAVAILLARGALLLPGILGADWRTGLVKTAVFAPIYLLILYLAEKEEMNRMITQARQLLGR
ncbi:MAG: oligosaccharide flippase family protein [Chloroflexota bacterium]